MTLATFDRIWSNYEVTKFNLKQVEKQNIFNKKQVLPSVLVKILHMCLKIGIFSLKMIFFF